MADDTGAEDSTPVEDDVADATRPPLGQHLRMIASDVLRPSSARDTSLPSKEIVNGLDRREVIVGAVLALAAVAIGFAGERALHDAKTVTDHGEAWPFFAALLIGAAVIALGTVLRRRALLGFACLLTGLALVTYHSLFSAVVYLGAASWLIFRVSQKKKQEQSTRSATPRAQSGGSKAPAQPGRPKASKRYTPPKRAAAGRRR